MSRRLAGSGRYLSKASGVIKALDKVKCRIDEGRYSDISTSSTVAGTGGKMYEAVLLRTYQCQRVL